MLSLAPNREETVCINCSLWVREETSQIEPLTSNPFACHLLKHSLSRVWSLSQVCTLAPKLASSSTIAHLKKKVSNSNPFVSNLLYSCKEKNKKSEKKQGNRAFGRNKTNPIPFDPPVTRALIPWRLHLLISIDVLYVTLSHCSHICN